MGASLTCATERSEPRTSSRDSGGTAVATAPTSLTPATTIAEGTHIRRYVIRGEIGRGGMGVVYRAFDPDLGRDIALKLLAVETGGNTDPGHIRERVFREAQALAKLSHPNIIAVHDVGRYQDDVFVAMEFVQGDTVDNWQRKRPRSWRETIAVFVAVGEGIAAAHAAGIIHRDVKPSNILVGDDKRVRLIDFGLARAADNKDINPDGHSPTSANVDGAYEPNVATNSKTSFPNGSCYHRPLVAARRTTEGFICGTPQYMAPEQRVAGAASESTDQFSFCAALYETLYGAPVATEAGRLLTPPAALGARLNRVPPHIHKACMRGLALRPDERFANMAELLGELRHDPAAKRQRIAWAVAAALICCAALAVALLRLASTDKCQFAATAEISSMWNDEAAGTITTTLASVRPPHGNATADRVRDILAARASAWASLRKTACEATWVRGDQSEVLLRTRMQCLAQRRNEQRALISVLGRQDLASVAVDRAVEAARGLPDLGLCNNVDALLTAYPAPGAAIEAQVDQWRQRLDEAEALILIGRHRLAVQRGQEIVRATNNLEYPPLLAQAQFVTAEALRLSGDMEPSKTAFEKAIEAATDARDDRLIARAAARWIWVVGFAAGRVAEAMATVPLAQSAAQRLTKDLVLQVDLLHVLGSVHYRARRINQAREHFRRALRLLDHAGQNDVLRRAKLLNTVGFTSTDLCDYDAATRALDRAQKLLHSQLGGNHPNVAIARRNLVSIKTGTAPQGFSAAAATRSRSLRGSSWGGGAMPAADVGHAARDCAVSGDAAALQRWALDPL